MTWRKPDETPDNPRALSLAGGLYRQVNEFHSLDVRPIQKIEIELLEQQLKVLKSPRKWTDIPLGTIVFNPSGASKCPRELYYKFKRAEKDERKGFPFQKRWTRNSSAVHEAVQKDFLYMEKVLENPKFLISRMPDGTPAWEENVKTIKLFEHRGVQFALSGMMDGILTYTPDGSQIGFEFKTKSNTIAQVGNYKMKDAVDYHKIQCVAYHHMFELDEFILMYEAVAKDYWHTGADAKMDIRTFYYAPTEKEKTDLFDKFADVVLSVYQDELPAMDTNKCMFCEYKDLCGRDE